MIRKRVPKLLTILATAACIFGFVVIAPAATENLPSISPMPTAGAQVMPNGFDVNCTKTNDLQVLCTVAGCPVVYEDYVADKIHTHINHDAENGIQVDKACAATYSRTIDTDAYKAFTFSVQGCDSVTVGTDNCGPYSHYEYVPPPKPVVEQPPVACGPNDTTATVPFGSTCTAKPLVDCPDGSPTPQAATLGECAAVPDVTNAITGSFNNIKQTTIDFVAKNSSKLEATCDYSAQGPLGDPTTRTFNVPANGSKTETFNGLRAFITYQVEVSCRDASGKQAAEMGHVSTSVQW